MDVASGEDDEDNNNTIESGEESASGYELECGVCAGGVWDEESDEGEDDGEDD